MEKAAQAAGVSPATWSTWERGAHPRDLLDVVRRVSEGLDVDRDWLVWGQTNATYGAPTSQYFADTPGIPAARDVFHDAVLAA